MRDVSHGFTVQVLLGAPEELCHTEQLVFTMQLTFFCLSDSEIDDVYNDLLHLDIW